jgi:hypothetical protein
MLWQPSYTTQQNLLRGSMVPACTVAFGIADQHKASRGRWRS